MRKVWQRWKYHLNALMLLVPLAFLPDQVAGDDAPRPAAPKAVERQVGPWHVAVSEIAPRRYAVSFRDGYPDRIRAAFVRFERPRDLKDAGVLLKGNPFRLQAQLPRPERNAAELWLTVEGWDGSIHQTAIGMAELAAAH